MRFWGIRKLDNQIKEARLASGRYTAPWTMGVEALEAERRSRIDARTLLISIGTMLITLFLAFGVPIWQSTMSEHADMQALYQSVVANGDISIINFNSLRYAQNTGKPLDLPESFIEFPVDERLSKRLQRGLGIDLYRYLRAYLEETKILNLQIATLHDEAVRKGTISVAPTPAIKAYETNLNLLNEGTWETAKFNYFYDTTCIEYLLTKAFPYLSVADRDQTAECSTDSLNRIYARYGYIEAEMPLWIRSQLRAALNEREKGLGDFLISLTRVYDGPRVTDGIFKYGGLPTNLR